MHTNATYTHVQKRMHSCSDMELPRIFKIGGICKHSDVDGAGSWPNKTGTHTSGSSYNGIGSCDGMKDQWTLFRNDKKKLEKSIS